MDIQKEHKKFEEKKMRSAAVGYIDQLIHSASVEEHYYMNGDGERAMEYHIGNCRFSSFATARSIIQNRIIPALVGVNRNLLEA